MTHFDPRRPLGAAVATAALVAAGAHAQFDASGVTLLGNVTLAEFPSNPGRGNDCWGYVSPSGREYALMGLRNALAVVEITDPRSPAIVASFGHPPTVWCDVKTYLHYAYVVTDGVGVGVQVIDLSDVDNGNVTLVTETTVGGQTRSHNIAINPASGYAYLAGSDVGGGRLLALSLADPENPTFAGQIDDKDSAYCHDAEVVTPTAGQWAGREIAFCSNGGAGLDIYDVTDKNDMVRLSRSTYPAANYTHQSSVSADLQYVYVNDELDGINRTTVFDVTDLENPVLVGDYSSGVAATDHNLYYHDGFIFEAEYQEGLRVFCAADPAAPVQVGWFDTYPEGSSGGFEGAWSVYPYFPSGNVIVSDRERGLFIVDVSGALSSGGVVLGAPDPLPAFVSPAGGTTVRIEAAGQCGGAAQAGSGLLHYDAGAGMASVPMQDVGPGEFDAVFPKLPCGVDVSYYVTVESASGGTFSLPATAPATTFVATAAAGTTPELVDDFETDNGWTTSFVGASSGFWERGVPIDDPGWPHDPESDGDGSGQCWLTGNVPGESDVDGGYVLLTSPLLDLGGGDLIIGYDYYLNIPEAAGDTLRVEVSAGGDAGPWVQAVMHQKDGGLAWRHATITPDALAQLGVPTTSTFKVRFTAGDLGADHTVEAGLDGFRLDRIDCDAGIPGDLDGDGAVDTVDFLALLAAWGPCGDCGDCPADLDGSCSVDTVDLLQQLANWG